MKALGVRRAATVAGALFRKDFRVAWSYRATFFVGHAYALTGVVVFYFVAPLVGQGDAVKTQEYFQFAIVGMVLGAIIEISVNSAVQGARSAQIEGTLEAVASMPVTSGALGAGWVAYPLAEGTASGIITAAFALPLGLWGADANLLSVAVVLLLSLVVFASLGLLGAGLVIAFQQGGGVIGLLLAFMIVFSGTVFPVEVMPAWLETLSALSPLRYSLDAMRDAGLHGASVTELGSALGALAAFAVVLLPAGLLALDAGFRRARRTGGLSGF